MASRYEPIHSAENVRLFGGPGSSESNEGTDETGSFQSSTPKSSVRPNSRKPAPMPQLSEKLNPRSQSNAMPYSTSTTSSGEFNAQSQPAWMNQSEADDWLHDPRDAKVHGSWLSNGFPLRAILNVGLLALIAVSLLALFAGYPIIDALTRHSSNKGGSNLGGTNSSGQIAEIPDFPNLIDPETPSDAMTRTGLDGKTKFQLVFSDEFNTDGRSFYPGDDPFWEAVDLWYWGTQNYEWYDPAAVTTAGGFLQITLSETPDHNKNFRGGMVQSWNKFCFTGGYLEASIRLPGYSDVGGLWPAFWMMGNLGRAGYGASLEGLWPYSYEECDVGTLPNQTTYDGTPASNAEGGLTAFNRQYHTSSLSWLQGQRLSACTCSGEDHPGPQVNGGFKGRAAPEIDVFEGQVGTSFGGTGQAMQVSQSFQSAPFNNKYIFSNTSGPAIDVNNPDITQVNSYRGAAFQQSTSVVSDALQSATEKGTKGQNNGGDFAIYGVEYTPGEDGTATWVNNNLPAWTLTKDALAADPVSQIGKRVMAAEPMYIIFNLGISQSFGTPNFAELTWPNTMTVDWVRVYQPADSINIGCDPSDYPTNDYINRHPDAYNNAQLQFWGQSPEVGGYGQNWPKNKLQPGNCNYADNKEGPWNPAHPPQKAPYVPDSALPNYGQS